MPRYVKQPPKTNICGPVAILNGLKWCGFNYTKKDLPWIKKKCKHVSRREAKNRISLAGNRGGGTTLSNIYFSLYKFGKVKLGTPTRASVEEIEKRLHNGYGVIVQIFYEHGGSHFVFCPKKTLKGNFVIVNLGQKTVIRMPRDKFRNMLSVKRDTVFAEYHSVFIPLKGIDK